MLILDLFINIIEFFSNAILLVVDLKTALLIFDVAFLLISIKLFKFITS